MGVYGEISHFLLYPTEISTNLYEMNSTVVLDKNLDTKHGQLDII